MKAPVEIYKGIEFVRISTLPEEQKKLIEASEFKNKIIKILRGNELLADCLAYTNYSAWYKHIYKSAPSSQPATPAKNLRLAFK